MATVDRSLIGAGLNYSHIQSWDDAVADPGGYNNNLAAAGVIWKGRIQMNAGDYQSYAISSSFGLSSMLVSGSTTSDDGYKHLIGYEGECFDELNDFDSVALGGFVLGAGMKGIGVGGAFTRFSESKALIERLVLTKGNTSQTFSCLQVASGARGRNLVCYSNNASQPSSGGPVALGPGSQLINSLIIVANAGYGIECTATDASPAHLLGTTVVRPSDASGGGTFVRWNAGTVGQSATLIAQGCAVFGFTTFSTGSSGGMHSSSDCNVTDFDDTNFDGANDVTSVANFSTPGVVFVDPRAGSHDFRVPAGSPLIGAANRIQIPSGVFPVNDDVAAGGPAQYEGTGDVDIALRPRSTTTPTAGAYEYIVENQYSGSFVGAYEAGLISVGGDKKLEVGPFVAPDQTTPVVDVTGLHWAFFDVATPRKGMVASEGSDGTTGTGEINGAGMFIVSIPESTLDRDDYGYLVISSTSGDADDDFDGWDGTVQVK